MLGACAGSGIDPNRRIATIPLPAIPRDVRECFDKMVPKPQQETMTVGDAVRLIGRLKQSEDRLSWCGKRLIEFYDSIRKANERK